MIAAVHQARGLGLQQPSHSLAQKGELAGLVDVAIRVPSATNGASIRKLTWLSNTPSVTLVERLLFRFPFQLSRSAQERSITAYRHGSRNRRCFAAPTSCF